MPSRCVLDACALVALFKNESGAETVSATLAEALSAGYLLPICAVNWCEVVYSAARVLGRAPREVVGALTELPLEFVDVNQKVAIKAAAVKAEYALGLGDSFAAALALELGLPLMTCDPDFDALEAHGLELARFA